MTKLLFYMGSSCSSVSRGVAFNAVRIQSSANYYIGHFLFTVNCIEKTKIKIKRPEWPFLKILFYRV